MGREETREAGLAKIFGTAEGQTKPSGDIPTQAAPTDPPIGEADTTKEGLLKQANESYETAIRAQREGDWGRYGEEIKKLGEILSKLRQ